MNRKLLIVAALFASTGYVLVACGGGGDEGKGAAVPTSSATMSATTPATTTVTASSASDTTSAMASATTPPPVKSLYERLGGKDAIGKVVDAFLGIVKDDKRINKFFAKTVADKKKLEALRNALVDFTCKATGGDCAYDKNMKDVHKDMKIKDADFDAFMEDFSKALDKGGVGDQEKVDLTSALQSMRADVVAPATATSASSGAPKSTAAMSAAPKSTAAMSAAPKATATMSAAAPKATK